MMSINSVWIEEGTLLTSTAMGFENSSSCGFIYFNSLNCLSNFLNSLLINSTHSYGASLSTEFSVLSDGKCWKFLAVFVSSTDLSLILKVMMLSLICIIMFDSPWSSKLSVLRCLVMSTRETNHLRKSSLPNSGASVCFIATNTHFFPNHKKSLLKRDKPALRIQYPFAAWGIWIGDNSSCVLWWYLRFWPRHPWHFVDSLLFSTEGILTNQAMNRYNRLTTKFKLLCLKWANHSTVFRTQQAHHQLLRAQDFPTSNQHLLSNFPKL